MKSFSLKRKNESDINVLEKMSNISLLTDNQITRIIDEILVRSRFKYGFKMIIDFMIRCLCLRNLQNMRKNVNIKKHYLYKRGVEKLE